jgi:hypothetical protein
MAGFKEVETTLSTRSLRIASPDTFWSGFISSAPPPAYLFKQLGAERTAQVGHVYMEALVPNSADGTPTLSTEAYIGIGRA